MSTRVEGRRLRRGERAAVRWYPGVQCHLAGDRPERNRERLLLQDSRHIEGGDHRVS